MMIVKNLKIKENFIPSWTLIPILHYHHQEQRTQLPALVWQCSPPDCSVPSFLPVITYFEGWSCARALPLSIESSFSDGDSEELESKFNLVSFLQFLKFTLWNKHLSQNVGLFTLKSVWLKIMPIHLPMTTTASNCSCHCLFFYYKRSLYIDQFILFIKEPENWTLNPKFGSQKSAFLWLKSHNVFET